MKDKALAYGFWIIVGVLVIVWAGPKFVTLIEEVVNQATEPIVVPTPPS